MPLPTIAYTASVPSPTSFSHPTTGQDNFGAILRQLTSGDISNTSVVPGASVTDALNALAGAVAPFAPLSALLWVDKGTAVAPASQTGSIAAPKATIQGGVNASPATGAALYIVGEDYSTEDVSVTGGSKLMAFMGTAANTALVNSLTSTATFRCQRFGVVGNVHSDDAIEMYQCFVGGTIGGSNLYLSGDPSFSNDFGIVSGTATASVFVQAKRWNFGSTVTTPALDANDCVFNGAVVATSGTGITANSCSFGTTVNASGLVATSCVFSGAVTATGDATITTCTFAGNLSVTGTLTIDTQSFVAAQQAGHTITAGTLIVTGGLNKQASVIGYTAAAPVSLQLLPAGHPPGFYLVGVSENVRTAATSGSLTAALTYTTPTTGAVTNTQLGLVVSPVTVTSVTPRNIESTGATALVLTYTPSLVVGSPVIDIFASAQRVGYT